LPAHGALLGWEVYLDVSSGRAPWAKSSTRRLPPQPDRG